MTNELHEQDAYAELMVDETVQQRSIELRAATLHEQANAAVYSYEFIDLWWESKGNLLSLDEIFDNEREADKIYGELK